MHERVTQSSVPDNSSLWSLGSSVSKYCTVRMCGAPSTCSVDVHDALSPPPAALLSNPAKPPRPHPHPHPHPHSRRRRARQTPPHPPTCLQTFSRGRRSSRPRNAKHDTHRAHADLGWAAHREAHTAMSTLARPQQQEPAPPPPLPPTRARTRRRSCRTYGFELRIDDSRGEEDEEEEGGGLQSRRSFAARYGTWRRLGSGALFRALGCARPLRATRMPRTASLLRCPPPPPGKSKVEVVCVAYNAGSERRRRRECVLTQNAGSSDEEVTVRRIFLVVRFYGRRAIGGYLLSISSCHL
ncbi:hypothetical protein LXA43DRAFT_85783 [Ganoderma leucocontextum]|nr:hypothetical protein LXA43DRAFT_85783 [Ganoderma leucocontextum]